MKRMIGRAAFAAALITTLAAFGDGSYAIGKGPGQVPAGTYTAPGGAKCAWARLGPADKVLAQGGGRTAQKVGIAGTDKKFRSTGCGDWKLAPSSPPKAPAIPAPRKYAGVGDHVLNVQKPVAGAITATISHTGSSNFAIWAEDKGLKRLDLLVNQIGGYKGTVGIDFRGTSTAFLEITADGPWTIELRSPLAARSFTAQTTGLGDDVVYYAGAARAARLTHAGTSNFAVWHYAKTGTDLLVNAIGAYGGTRPLRAPGFMVIQADGAWTIK